MKKIFMIAAAALMALPLFAKVPGCVTVTRDRLLSGEKLMAEEFPRCSKKGNSLVFSAGVESFGKLTIGMGFESYRARWIVIDGKGVSLYTREKENTLVESFEHGVTVKDFIVISIRQRVDGKSDFILQSGGSSFRQVLSTTTDMNGCPQVICDGTVLSDVRLSCGNADLDKDIWLFGDSYFGINSARWPGYLKDAGYVDGYYINGLAGQNSKGALDDLKRALALATPKFLVWCLGMNDPDERWLTCFEEVKSICRDKGICLVLSTVPSVPTRSKELINKTVRESGLRYVDFSKAVGATPDGTWYEGCLHTDGVHPTPLGARYLAMRFLADFPEITLTAYSEGTL